ncbi:helix-turn-helix domain-containing protein [Verrucomicrobium spinosum]|uniref:LysR family transcriptional regulator n=1 Tax=Verrucomicrobium spinosum TaxID=2736 RepID=UPI0009466B2A
MDIRELRSFVTLAEHLHYGRAARLLNLSQPALTKQILRLEEALGSPLFEWCKGRSRLDHRASKTSIPAHHSQPRV